MSFSSEINTYCVVTLSVRATVIDTKRQSTPKKCQSGLKICILEYILTHQYLYSQLSWHDSQNPHDKCNKNCQPCLYNPEINQIIDIFDWLDLWIVSPLRLRLCKEIQSQSPILGVKHNTYNELFCWNWKCYRIISAIWSFVIGWSWIWTLVNIRAIRQIRWNYALETWKPFLGNLSDNVEYYVAGSSKYVCCPRYAT